MKNSPIFWLLIICTFMMGCTTEEVIFDRDAQFVSDNQAIDNFLSTNNINTVMHPNGVSYVVLDTGDGVSANTACRLDVKMTVHLLDSTYVFSNYAEVEEQNGFFSPFNPLFHVYRCYEGKRLEGLHILDELVGRGGKVQFFVPSRLGWASEGFFRARRLLFIQVPPNTNLLITAELINLE